MWAHNKKKNQGESIYEAIARTWIRGLDACEVGGLNLSEVYGVNKFDNRPILLH